MTPNYLNLQLAIMNRITRSLPHYHLGMAKHLVINHVALLHCVENLTFHRLVWH